MNNMERITQDIFLLKIPFMSVFTSVFIIRKGNELTVYDSATTKEDVQNYILPAISEFEKDGCKVKRIVISHFHGDHSGGLKELSEHFAKADIYVGSKTHYNEAEYPHMVEVTDGENIDNDVYLYRLPGHSHDCVAIFDSSTKTLLTADAFQGFGIMQYGVNGDIDAWMDSIKRVKEMDVEQLITSHDYFALGQTALGKENVIRYLDGCKDAFREIFDFDESCRKKGLTDNAEIARLFCEQKKKAFSDFPTIHGACFENVRKHFIK